MYCFKCGTEISDKAKVCPNCNQVLNENQQNSYNSTQTYYQPNNQNYNQTNNQSYYQPNEQYYNSNTDFQQNQQKSAYIAGLLAFFLGTLGVHNYYLGNNNRATAQLLLSLLTFGIGAVFVQIWTIIEGIQLFTGSINVDADGVALKQSF